MSRFTSLISPKPPMSALCSRWLMSNKSSVSIVSPPSTSATAPFDTLPTMTASEVAAFKYADRFQWQRVVTIRRDGQYRVGGQPREAKYRPVLSMPPVAPLNTDYSIASMPTPRRVVINRPSVQRAASCDLSSSPRVASRRVGSRFAVLPTAVAPSPGALSLSEYAAGVAESTPSTPSADCDSLSHITNLTAPEGFLDGHDEICPSTPSVGCFSLSDMTNLTAPEGWSRDALLFPGLEESPVNSVSPSLDRVASVSRRSTSTMSESDWTPIHWPIECSVRNNAGPVKFPGYSDSTMTDSDWTPIHSPRVTRPAVAHEPEVGRSCPQESSFVEDSSLCAPTFILSKSNFKSIVSTAAIPVDAYKLGPIPGAWPEYADDTASTSWSFCSGFKKVASWFGQFF